MPGPRLARNFPTGRVRAERPQQLDVVLADVEQRRLDALLLDGLAVDDGHPEGRPRRAPARRRGPRRRSRCGRCGRTCGARRIRCDVLRPAMQAPLVPSAARARSPAPPCAATASTTAAAPVQMPGAVPHVEYDGIQKLHYEFGPIEIKPGQNTIEFEPNQLKPQVPGYITRFEPNLIRTQRQRPAGRRDPPAPRRVADAQLPDVRGGRGEDDHAVPARLRLPLRRRGPLGHEPHDPQPPAGQGRAST